MLPAAALAGGTVWSERHRAVRPQSHSAWCAFRPASWSRTTPAVDLVGGCVRWREEPSVGGRRSVVLDDTVYEPDAAVCAELVRRLSAAGTACVAQLTAEELAGSGGGLADLEGVLVVVDPLLGLRDPELGLAALGGQERGVERCALLLPLVGGLAEPGRLEGQIEVAIGLGFTTIVPMVLALEPRDLRRLAEVLGLDGGEALRLFHSSPPEVREVRRRLRAAGVRWWLGPLESGRPPRGRRIRHVSRGLDLVAHLASCAGRPPGFVEGHRQAARRLEEDDVDVRELLRSGDLRLLEWMDRRTAATLERWFQEDPGMAGPPPGLSRLEGEAVADSPQPVDRSEDRGGPGDGSAPDGSAPDGSAPDGSAS